MRRYYLEVWERGNLAAERELVATDIVDHMPFPNQPAGWEGHHFAVGIIQKAFPDAQFTIEDLITEGDKVSGRWTMRATHRGEILGIPATGKSVTMTGSDIVRWANGKAAEVWHVEAVLGLFQQLGVVPTPG